jgi:hypothetical protein
MNTPSCPSCPENLIKPAMIHCKKTMTLGLTSRHLQELNLYETLKIYGSHITKIGNNLPTKSSSLVLKNDIFQ